MPNDNTSTSLLAAYLGKKPVHLLKNFEFRKGILSLIYDVINGSSTTTTTTSHS